MVTRTFLDKSNTIINGSQDNFGLHPICMLNYGGITSRMLIHFPIENIQKFVEENNSECKHILRMTNCGYDAHKIGKTVPSSDMNGEKQRAVSFSLYAYEIDSEWDDGIGFDESSEFWLTGASAVSIEASNWYNAKSGLKWEKSGCIDNEVNNAIASQEFPRGNEDLELDITEYVNSIIYSGVPNNGLCICFSPDLENDETKKYTQYVGFFGPHTNTFFEPCVESKIDDAIQDNRFDFGIGKTNRLYLYCCLNGEYVNLDTMPTCTILDTNDNIIETLVSEQQGKGIYYVETKGKKYKNDRIYYDVWSNLSLDGVTIDEVEMQFTAHPSAAFFSIGPDKPDSVISVPSLSGINDGENLIDDDIRKVDVRFRIPYSTKFETLNNCYYRIYSLDGNREIVIIDWDKIHNTGDINYFLIKANELVTGNYYVDIKVNTKLQTKTFKNSLHFKKVGNVTKITH